MNEIIIENWNKVIKPEDIVYHLGDVMLNDDREGINCLRRLNGKIYILTGNHDTSNRIQKYVNISPNILHLGLAVIINYKNYKFYLSHYPTITSNFDENKSLVNRIISIAGHSHTQNKFKDMDKGLIFHAELDTNNNKPWLLDDIITELKNYNKEPVKTY